MRDAECLLKEQAMPAADDALFCFTPGSDGAHAHTMRAAIDATQKRRRHYQMRR